MIRYLFLSDSYVLVLSDERAGLSFVCAAGLCQRILYRVLVPLGLRPYFTVSDFETSLFVASYDSQGHGGGIRPRLHTGVPILQLTALVI
jgi:hypothetical protein